MRSPKGRLELTWMGKDMALIPPRTASTTTSGWILPTLALIRHENWGGGVGWIVSG